VEEELKMGEGGGGEAQSGGGDGERDLNAEEGVEIRIDVAREKSR
jgi:hypothetical protein